MRPARRGRKFCFDEGEKPTPRCRGVVCVVCGVCVCVCVCVRVCVGFYCWPLVASGRAIFLFSVFCSLFSGIARRPTSIFCFRPLLTGLFETTVFFLVAVRV
ncbi:hypothetical protein QBC47DRAFT_388864 [Echria macrotheca]|uniref:Uncharacterized protein n=1 Tax=Echria macrotheca TaxID=438768 RepID=A0AAJ0F8X2_9PEZI|nr:hypothetical protein QBC47DRAFT_388864 [Echria macrotheca]